MLSFARLTATKRFNSRRTGARRMAYGMLDWSPDSKTLVAFRIEPGERKEVHLIESSPREGGRAILQSRPYASAGRQVHDV